MKIRMPAHLFSEEVLNYDLQPSSFSVASSYEFTYLPIKFKDKNITRYRIYTTASRYQEATILDKATIHITYENGSQEFIAIKSAAIEPIKELSNRYEYKYVGAGHEVLDWTDGIEKHYQPQVYDDYHRLGVKIISALGKVLAEQKEEAYLFDLGCGDGRFIKELAKHKLFSKHKLTLVGIDSSPHNIKNADKDSKGCEFVLGDVLNIRYIIKNYPADKPIIITALGVMTDLVLNIFNSIELLQELATIPNLICILGGGEMPVVFKNNNIASKVGFEGKVTNPVHFFCFKPKDNPKILETILKDFKTAGKLDLSFSPNPDFWLSHSEISKEIKIRGKDILIDISYCKFNEKLGKRILELSYLYPKIQWKFFGWKDAELEHAKKFFKEHSCDGQVKKVNNGMYLIDPTPALLMIDPGAVTEPIETVITTHEYIENFKVPDLKDVKSVTFFQTRVIPEKVQRVNTLKDREEILADKAESAKDFQYWNL